MTLETARAMDSILEILTIENATYTTIAKSRKEIEAKTNLRGIRLTLYLNLLQKDGYIEPDKASGLHGAILGGFIITEEGQLFIEEFGYTGKFNAEISAKNHAEQVEKAMLVNNTWTRNATLVAAGATVLILIWDMIKYGVEHHFCCPH